jgi:hypothetical protein
MTFSEAFSKFIKGQVVVGWHEVYAFGDHNLSQEKRFYGYGTKYANGYKLLFYGGGASGEDYNSSFIVNDKDELIAASGEL